MIFKVKVIPNAKKESISCQDQNLKVYVKAPASDNKANKSLIVLLAKHYNTKKGSILILKGQKSRDKIIEITN